MARILFGAPGDFAHRHPRLMLSAVIVLVLLSQWLVDVATAALVTP
jgi:hypothetical protein